LELDLVLRDQLACLVEDQEPAAGRALVDSANERVGGCPVCE
jgi:hypothetical protein